ncbi:hypothetical protein SHELI_v1c07080 [Spiroplasma helicoides]|uniref:Uncharacterized protein n=1 Tax=Spiroplasma helicoides TaxID=216938 RepID=A0A1B3SL59_9MOLU|nr:hypothetical protein [Spiroplasma helicoides]AOG60657.1 hypothetical protein SHELI_v1c07080 [Spiroplasma helicoides]
MDNSDLLKRIAELEQELEIYKEKEDFYENGMASIQEMALIARKNSERIIARSVEIAFRIKDIMQKGLARINNNPNDYEKIVKEFLEENKELFELDSDKIQAMAKNIAEKVEKYDID